MLGPAHQRHAAGVAGDLGVGAHDLHRHLEAEFDHVARLPRAADLRRHFRNWLPKYQAKREIAAKGHTPSACGHLSKEFYESHRLSIAAPDLLAKGDRRQLHPLFRGT